MRIKRLYIGDFGILRHQILEELAPGIIVIGGRNRSGKTTLLQVLRHLGYGFNKGALLPPPNSKYEVQSDLLLDTGDLYTLSLTGYGEPQVSCVECRSGIKRKLLASDLYNNLDSYTYRQLFTISIDELQRIPRGSEKKLENLQSVLIGAGFSDLVQIPSIIDELGKEADKIGGKKGDPAVKRFGDFHRQIKEGLQLKKKALDQVHLYQQKVAELKITEEESAALAAKLEENERQIIKLDLLKNNFDKYNELKELNQTLSAPRIKNLGQNPPSVSSERATALRDEYLEVLKNYEHYFGLFQQALAAENVSAAKEKLLGFSKELEYHYRQLSGLKEKVKSYEHALQQLQVQKESLLAEMKRLNKSWGESFACVMEIGTDTLDQDLLVQTVETYGKLKQEERDKEQELENLHDSRHLLAEQLKELNHPDSLLFLKRYFLYAILFLASGAALFFVNAWWGLITGLTGIVGTGLYLMIKYMAESSLRSQKQNMEWEYANLTRQYNTAQEKMAIIQQKIEPIAQKLHSYRLALGLPAETSPEMIKETFRSLQDLKNKITGWLQLEKNLQDLTGKLKKELQEIVRILDEIRIYFFAERGLQRLKDNLLEQTEDIFFELEKTMEYLSLARHLQECEQKKEELTQKIEPLLTKEAHKKGLPHALFFWIEDLESYEQYKQLEQKHWHLEQQILHSLKTDRVRKIFAGNCANNTEERTLLASFNSFAEEFISAEHVSISYAEAQKGHAALKEDLDRLKERAQSLRSEVKKLATSENLQKAQKKINEARAGLRPLAEKYALYCAAAFLLKQVQVLFMQKTKDNLLSRASKILKQITAGEYEKIFLPEKEGDFDLGTLGRDSKSWDTADILSRATREQLFLAVRISRIQEIEPPLPVIIDDSLVNFDCFHLLETLKIITDLAQSHQIFILTCHPELVKYLSTGKESVQYWKLDRGKFSLSNGQELIDCLSKED